MCVFEHGVAFGLVLFDFSSIGRISVLLLQGSCFICQSATFCSTNFYRFVTEVDADVKEWYIVCGSWKMTGGSVLISSSYSAHIIFSANRQ